MSDPTTATGRNVLVRSRLHTWAAFDKNDITQIEQEAAEAERARIRAAVEGLHVTTGEYRTDHWIDQREVLAILDPRSDPLTEYGACGSLQWTVEKWGRVTHKHACPNRTDPWCQTHPERCDPRSDKEPG